MEHPNAIKLPQLPFVTREMLDWGAKAELDLEIIVVTANTNPFEVSGATKATPFSYGVTPTGNGARESFTRRITDIPLFVSVHTDDANETPGSLWIEVYLRGARTRLLKLCGGYIFRGRSISWPYAQGTVPLNELAPPIGVNVTNPATGANLSLTVPTGQLWKIYGLTMKFVADANAATRIMHLQVNSDAGALLFDFFPNQNQTLGQTRTYVYSAMGAVQDQIQDQKVPVLLPPELILTAGMVLQTSITNIQVGDEIKNVRIQRVEMALET